MSMNKTQRVQKEKDLSLIHIWMLKVNTPDGFLPVRGRGVDDCSYYEYDVSGKVSMKAMYELSLIHI